VERIGAERAGTQIDGTGRESLVFAIARAGFEGERLRARDPGPPG